MATRRYAPINAPMTEAAKAETVTITGDWTFTAAPILGVGGGESLTITDDVVGGNTYNAWIQWEDSAGAEQGYIGFGSSSNEDFYINNQAGGDVRIPGTFRVESTSVFDDSALFQGTAIDLNADPNASGWQVRCNTGSSTWARGVPVYRDSDNARIGGFGYLGSGETLTSWHVGFGSSFWSTDSVFDLTASAATFDVDTTINGSLTVDPDDAGPYLMLGDGATASGDVLLRFYMDRTFQFQQVGDDGSTGLGLRSTTAGKYIYFLDDNQTAITRWYANSAGTNYFDLGGNSIPTQMRIYDEGAVQAGVLYGDAHAKDSVNMLRMRGRNSGGGFRMQQATLADDATGTFAMPTYGIVFIASSYNRTAQIITGITTTQAPTSIYVGTNAALGTTNPDTDGKMNVWPSASQELSIKNRLGSSRVFYVFTFGDS